MESDTFQTETSDTLLDELSTLNMDIENVIRDELDKLRLEELKLKKLILTKAKQDLYDLLKNDPSIEKGSDEIEISMLNGSTNVPLDTKTDNSNKNNHVVQPLQHDASITASEKARNIRESIDHELVSRTKNNLPKNNALAKTAISFEGTRVISSAPAKYKKLETPYPESHVTFENWTTNIKPKFLTKKNSGKQANLPKPVVVTEKFRSKSARRSPINSIPLRPSASASMTKKTPTTKLVIKKFSKSMENLQLTKPSPVNKPWHYAKSTASCFPKRDSTLRNRLN